MCRVVCGVELAAEQSLGAKSAATATPPRWWPVRRRREQRAPSGDGGAFHRKDFLAPFLRAVFGDVGFDRSPAEQHVCVRHAVRADARAAPRARSAGRRWLPGTTTHRRRALFVGRDLPIL